MPQAFAWLALEVFEVATDLGASVTVAATIANVVALSATIGTLVGVAALFGPQSSPTPEGLRQTSRQAIPARRRACGVARMGGALLVDYADTNSYLYRVVAFCDRPPETIYAYYLSQDQVVVNDQRGTPVDGGSGNVVTMGAGLYEDSNQQSLCGIQTHFGVSGTPSFPDLTTLASSVWPSTSSGTGIFMGFLFAPAGDLKWFPYAYPRGKPQLNVVASVGPVFDWRDDTQSITDPTTWTVSQNPVVNLVHELWAYRGYDYDLDFLPALDVLTAEADVCDAPIGALNVLAKVIMNVGYDVTEPSANQFYTASTVVHIAGPNVPPNGVTLYLGGVSRTVVSSTAATDDYGGYLVTISAGLPATLAVGSVIRWQATPENPITEPTYACGGAWNVDEAEADTVKRFTDAMDGWMMRRGSDGAVIIRAGHYYEPTITITADEVIGYSYQPFVEASKVVNQILPSFVCPAYDYNQIDSSPRQNDADIAIHGLSSQPFKPDMVQSNGQVQRLAKRRLSRLLSHPETLTLKASGLRALGERYICVQLGYDEVDAWQNIVLEIVGDAEIVSNGMAVTFQVQPADSTIDEWDPYTDEGAGPADSSAPSTATVIAPTIVSASPAVVSSGDAGSGVQITVVAAPPSGFSANGSLAWFLQWQAPGASSWSQAQYTELPAGDVTLTTGFVTANATIDVQVAYQTPGGVVSPWSASVAVDTTTGGVAPSPPTALTVTEPSSGLAKVDWRNSTSAAFDHARIYQGATATFSAATDVSGALPGSAGALESFEQSGLAVGTYYFWVVAENATDAQSAPAGPAEIAIT